MRRPRTWAARLQSIVPLVVMGLVMTWSYLAYVLTLCGACGWRREASRSCPFRQLRSSCRGRRHWQVRRHVMLWMGAWLTDAAVFLIVLDTVLLVLLAASYYQSALRSPGGPPDEFAMEASEYTSRRGDPDALVALLQERLAHPLDIFLRHTDGSLRYCDHCQVIKPDRTHHCGSCDRCVLRMDHHCIFIGTCVGFHNHRYFLQLVCYGALYAFTAGSTALTAVLTAPRVRPAICVLQMVLSLTMRCRVKAAFTGSC